MVVGLVQAQPATSRGQGRATGDRHGGRAGGSLCGHQCGAVCKGGLELGVSVRRGRRVLYSPLSRPLTHTRAIGFATA